MKYKGSCHCGAVHIEVEAPDPVGVENCYCSIYSKSGYLHLIVPGSNFSLLVGESQLRTYSCNTSVARHYSRKICGIKPYYIPRSNPDGVDVNVNCLDEQPVSMSIVDFDGRNWEQHAHKLAHKSRPS